MTRPAVLLTHSGAIADDMGGEWPAEKFDGLVKVHTLHCRTVFRPGRLSQSSRYLSCCGTTKKIKLAMTRATTPAFKVVRPMGKVRPGPPGWDVPTYTSDFTRGSRCFTKAKRPKQRATISTGSATGTGCFFAAIVSGSCRAGPLQFDENLLENAGADAGLP